MLFGNSLDFYTHSFLFLYPLNNLIIVSITKTRMQTIASINKIIWHRSESTIQSLLEKLTDDTKSLTRSIDSSAFLKKSTNA